MELESLRLPFIDFEFVSFTFGFETMNKKKYFLFLLCLFFVSLLISMQFKYRKKIKVDKIQQNHTRKTNLFLDTQKRKMKKMLKRTEIP